MKSIYLDYAASTPVRDEVLLAMMPFFQKEYSNAGSIHDFGQFSMEAISHAREQVAAAIGASSPREVIFTNSGTESNNMAIIGSAWSRKSLGNHIITTQIEHPSILGACHFLENAGFNITYLPVDHNGLVHINHVKEAITPQTIIVSVMAANNETGTIQPIKEIGRLLEGTNVLFHSDAVQYFGKVPMSVTDLGVDLLSIGGHKVYGPKGIGALYIRNGVRIHPLFHGGGQERGIRPGTPNTPAIVGFGLAAKMAADEVGEEYVRLTKLRSYAWQRIRKEVNQVVLNGHPTLCLPSHLNLSFDSVEGQAILLELNRSNIYVSSGSACSAGKHLASHVLKAMGTGEEVALQSVRVTMGRDTTTGDLDVLVRKLCEILSYYKLLLPKAVPSYHVLRGG